MTTAPAIRCTLCANVLLEPGDAPVREQDLVRATTAHHEACHPADVPRQQDRQAASRQ